MPSIYDYPSVYDAIMRVSTDQLDLEIETIAGLLREHGDAHGRILEIASGTSPHGIALAKCGYGVTGIDLSQAMIAYAQTQTAETQNEYICADLRDFALPDASFDGAIFMSETFPLFVEYDEIVNHFDAVHRHLKKGGFYLVDLDAQRKG